jgi:predicted Ser/Thr protein kinase
MTHASAAVSDEHELVIAGRYRVEKLLGRGGMGAVYAVLDTASERRVALKRLAADASTSMAALFEREYHTLAGLRHPCIVEVYDYGSDATGAFYTMELIEGRDLSKDAPLPWRSACRDLRDAASILGLLHARRLLHRDLSPRNLLRSQSGRLKLIDFGALSPFGPSKELVGTPPFIAPETLQGGSLDQRVDLFALGALAYWLVTGSHAYPARTLSELPALWKSELSAPSELFSLLSEAPDDPIPAELDALILSLLRLSPKERLDSTAELIDRLNALAELAPETHDLAAQGYLDSKAFVGRLRERERALALLSQAEVGRVQTLVVEGAAGIGRSRFLQELVVVSRLAGALPVVADAQLGARPYGVAETLLMGLLRGLPAQTRSATAEHAQLLSHISGALRSALSVSGRPSLLHAPGELRVRALAALREVVLQLARERLLVFIVDDLQAIDDESQALLTALARAEGDHKLLIVASLGRDGRSESSAALTQLRTQAARVRLLPLNADETLELLRSVFGQVPYLERLAERLHRASDGNPAYCLELAEHLMQSGQARYQDGQWSLPAELSPDSLPASRQAAHVTRLERLSADARELARRLSVPHGLVLALDHCFAVSDLPPARVHEMLAELDREGVLRATAGGHRFAHGEVQAAVYAELPEATRKLSHLRLGEAVAAVSDADVLLQLSACLHFMRGGDLKRGYVELAKVIAFYRLGDMATLRVAAPLLEQVLVLQREHGESEHATVGVLGLLAIAGYFADRRFATRYGDEGVATLRRVLCLPLAERLRRLLGGKLALIVALVVAGVSLALRRKRLAPLQSLLLQLMGAASALAGASTTFLDLAALRRYVAVLRPFTALGPEHAASLTYQFAKNLELIMSDHPARACEQLSAYADKLERPGAMPGVAANVRDNFTAGTIFTLGVLQASMDGPECLATADRLERFGPVRAMSADYIRSSWYASQGQLQRSEQFRKRMEVHAVTLGSAWQVETWAPVDGVKIALRHDDPARMKRAVQELGRLSSELPSLRSHEQAARGAYLVQRGKFAQALPLLDVTSDGPANRNYTRARGLLARALNGLGQHARAKELCLTALAALEAGDRVFVMLTLNTQIELALAELGLGHGGVAKAQLDALIVEHEPGQSPITLGALHQALVRVALRERDFARARAELAKMEAYYRTTDVATLLAQSASLRRAIDRAENPRGLGSEGEEVLRAARVMTRVKLALSHHGSPLVTVRAQKGLQIALELSSADEGFIVLAESEGDPVAHLGDQPPSAELVLWAEQNLLEASTDEQTVMTEEVDSEIDSNYKVVGTMRYCVVPLLAERRHQERVVAALVLGFDGRVPQLPEPAVMRAIAAHLVADVDDAA